MAKITITIEDGTGAQKGTVRCTSSPSFETMAKILERGHPPTDAEAYALMALTSIYGQSKKLKQERQQLIASAFSLPKPKGIM